MAWIKRNLFFVISVAVGLLLTGYCAYLLYNSLNDNAGVSDDYKSTLDNLQAMQQKTPFPSKENIHAAKSDQDKVRQFLADFRTRFASFPAPPEEDEKGFKTYLEESLVRFREEATNAGVQVPAEYAFSFSSLIGKLTYPPGNIRPWMQQLEEISAILEILYHAKINYLWGLQRSPVSADETGSADYVPVAVVTNQWGVVAPYKVTFRGFSADIAAVMEGFARSSNCFIIKAIAVEPDKSVQPVTAQPPPQQPAVTYAPMPRYSNPAFNQPRDREMPRLRPPVAAAAAPVVPGAGPVVYGPPVTILSESPLLVTVSVDVVKLKASDH